MRDQGVIVLAILAGGWIGHFLKVPSGILVGGMIAGLFAKGVTLGEIPSGTMLSMLSQFLVAYVVVSNSDVASIRTHPEVVPAALSYVAVLLVLCIGLAFLVTRFFGIDLNTAIYATAPGGLSGMALSAADAGAETPLSLVFHMFRMVIVLIVTPLVALYFTK